VLAVEVDYTPGAASPSHTHAKSAFIYAYVISGAIESNVNDGETRIYRAGESWSEPPGAIHSISRNASRQSRQSCSLSSSSTLMITL
jgi:quercetin dioxygenase-like cupin family protein